jgi:hypothetical protein
MVGAADGWHRDAQAEGSSEAMLAAKDAEIADVKSQIAVKK